MNGIRMGLASVYSLYWALPDYLQHLFITVKRMEK